MSKPCPTPRWSVYAALDSERAYQDATSARWQHLGAPSLEAEMLLLEEYLAEARNQWRTQKGNAEALNSLRKLGGVLVRCFETYGVQNRAPSQ